MRPLVMLIAALAGAFRVAGADVPPTARTDIDRAIRDPARPLGDRRADAVRERSETLAFAGVRLGMIVGEFHSGDGHFTRLLSGVVGPPGFVYPIENRNWRGSIAADRIGGRGRPISDPSIRGHTDQDALKFVKPDASWISRAKRLIKTLPVLIPARN